MRVNASVAAEDVKRLSAQRETLRARLQRGPITNVDAMVDLRILNLTARVSELRQAGHNVIAEKVPGQRGVWRYSLAAPLPVGQLELL